MQSKLKYNQVLPEKSYRDFITLVEERYGLQLNWYNKNSLIRRLLKVMDQFRVNDLYTLMLLVSSDRSYYEKFLDRFTVQVTEFFREPKGWLEMRESVCPILRHHKQIKVLLVGASTGEELASLAIMLKEEGLLDKAEITLTDISDSALNRNMKPTLIKSRLKEAELNYRLGGGKADLSSYYQSTSSLCFFNPDLFKKVKAQHFDITQSELGQKYDLILCRNLLIYFQSQYQHYPLARLIRHLNPGGFLSLGEQESIAFYRGSNNLQIVSSSQKIYRQDVLPE